MTLLCVRRRRSKVERHKILTDTMRESCVKACDRIKEMFLNGECDHLTAADVETWMQLSNPEKYFTGEEAMKYMRLSNTKFYNYRKANLIGAPVKIKGFHKPLYTKAVLDKAIETLSATPETRIRIMVLAAKANDKKRKAEESAVKNKRKC